MYFSEIIGHHWPNKEQLTYSKNIAKTENISAQIRFDNISKRSSPDYFIITDIESFESQPELKHLLDTKFEILDNSECFVIYDLKKTKRPVRN